MFFTDDALCHMHVIASKLRDVEKILLCSYVCAYLLLLLGFHKKTVAPETGELDEHVKNPSSTYLFGPSETICVRINFCGFNFCDLNFVDTFVR